MRILYFGLPLGAVWLTRAGFPPAAMALGHPAAPGGRRVRRQARDRLVLGRPALDDPHTQEVLAAVAPSLILSFFWPRKIPPAILALAPALGTHPSLLPRWRGPDPYFWALRVGDRETGVTLHRLDASYDTGSIVAQRRLAIRPTDDSGSLARRLDRPALALLVEAARRHGQGDPLEGRPQEEGKATEAPQPDDEALAIDWRRSADSIARLVRAAAPEPGATAVLGETTILVRRARHIDARPPLGLRVAEAWQRAGTWCVRCGEGAIALDALATLSGDPIDAGTLLR